MPKDVIKMQSWQIFHFARKHLGSSVLYAIFGTKNARAVNYYCENPRDTAKSENAFDPIKGVKTLLDSLDDQGHCGVVRATIDFLAAGTSAERNIDPKIVDPLPNISEEILADFRAVAKLQQAIEADCDVVGVEHLMNEAIAEIERTVARYRKDLK